MRVVIAERLEWQAGDGCSRALLHSQTGVKVEMLEVAAGASLAPHKGQREFLCVVFSGGAQLRLGDRVFRPLAGQTFEREPGEEMEIVNDSLHPIRVLCTQVG